mmetsp:Transcript_85611/g.223105  ORF Transcript_85611/g.223105 Transcript_85611/m.223105 type:complete len:417 (-) Transcript_85611:50-1300(-)
MLRRAAVVAVPAGGRARWLLYEGVAGSKSVAMCSAQRWWSPLSCRAASGAAGTAEGLAMWARTLLLQAIGSSEAWQCSGRAGLAVDNLQEELAALHKQVVSLGSEALGNHLNLADLSVLCRLLTAAGFLPDRRLFVAGATQLRKHLSSGSCTGATFDAGAGLALAACEAGEEQGLGSELVGELCAAGAARTHGENALGGSGAAALALAAAAAGRADGPLLEALLIRCSLREIDLCPAMLGDLRLAALLAGPAATEQLDIRALSFLRTLCLDARLDDPRLALLPAEAGAFDEALTPFEAEVSESLGQCEIPHARAALASGLFLPLSAVQAGGASVLGGAAARGQLAIFAEDAAARAVYINDQSKRSAFQRWKYRAVAAAGWRVFPVEDGRWRALAGREERSGHLKELLLAGPLEPTV